MPYFEAIRLALMQIRVQKLKSFFTLLGVTIGVMFLIAVVSIVNGMGSYIKDFAGDMGGNTFTLSSRAQFTENADATALRAARRRPPLTLHDVEAIATALPAGTRWTIVSQGPMRYATSTTAPQRQLEPRAVEGDYFEIRNYEVALGRAFSPMEEQVGASVVVIGDEVAKHFFPSLDPIGRELRIGGIDFEVIGVIEPQGSFFGQSLDRMAIAPFRSPLGRLINRRGTVGSVTVQAPTAIMLSDAQEVVRGVMRGRRGLRPANPDNFSIRTSAAELAEFNQAMAIATLIGSVLPAIGLVVGGIVIMNIMLVAVAERTHEIGIRKSLGARRKDILRQFLVEAATLSTIGAIFGIGLGILGAQIIEWKTVIEVAVAPWSLVVATLLGTVVGITAGVYPASRASRLDPIEALRQE
jgi:putative ABC transport system permease protein